MSKHSRHVCMYYEGMDFIRRCFCNEACVFASTNTSRFMRSTGVTLLELALALWSELDAG
eukprot:5817931-Amphidinium_carterae.1